MTDPAFILNYRSYHLASIKSLKAIFHFISTIQVYSHYIRSYYMRVDKVSSMHSLLQINYPDLLLAYSLICFERS
jgi:hypothetical protein